MNFVFNAIVFIVGLVGYCFFLYGIWSYQPLLAYVLGGAIAMWWSWYASIGAKLQIEKLKNKGES